MQNNQVRYPVIGHGHILISVPGFDRSGADCVYLMQQEGYFREGVIYGPDCGVQDLLLSGEYGIHRTQVNRKYTLVIVPTDVLHESRASKVIRTTKRLREYVETLYPGSSIATTHAASLAVSLRRTLTDECLQNTLKVQWIALLHNPILNNLSIPMILRPTCGFDGKRLVSSHARDSDEWDAGGAVAVVLPEER